jgi:hypothetical protein
MEARCQANVQHRVDQAFWSDCFHHVPLPHPRLVGRLVFVHRIDAPPHAPAVLRHFSLLSSLGSTSSTSYHILVR